MYVEDLESEWTWTEGLSANDRGVSVGFTVVENNKRQRPEVKADVTPSNANQTPSKIFPHQSIVERAEWRSEYERN